MGFVFIEGEDVRVLVFGIGIKCIGCFWMSFEGDVVNDVYVEVIV